MKPPNRIPNPLGQLGILQQTIRPRRIKRAHAHIHTRKRENPSQPLSKKIIRRPTPNALKRMQPPQMPQKRRANHGPEGKKVLLQHMRDGLLVMVVRLLQEGKVAPEPGFALEALDFALHEGQIRREGEGDGVVEVHAVIGFAFQELDAFFLHRCVQVAECGVEDLGQQKQAGALVEALGTC